MSEVNEFCLANIMKMSERKEVLASEDIYDAHGTKLWAKGARVSASLQEKLLRRRLAKPLETILVVEDGVTMTGVATEAQRLLDENGALRALAGGAAIDALKRAAAYPLPPPLTLLLTAAREDGGNMFRHSAAVALLACGLGARQQVAGNAEISLAFAAVLHDIGELYLNPEYLHSRRQLLPSEWKQVAAHPRIGRLLVEELTRLPRSVALAISEHHERLDGTGYPAQLDGPRLSPAGVLLSAAEALVGILGRGDGEGLARAGIALRIVPGQFLASVNDAVSAAKRVLPPSAGHSTVADAGSVEAAQALERRIADGVARTAAILAERPAGALGEFVRALHGQLERLLMALRATGVTEAAFLVGDDADEETLLELGMTAREINWRLRHLARNLHLHADLVVDGRVPDGLAALVALLDED